MTKKKKHSSLRKGWNYTITRDGKPIVISQHYCQNSTRRNKEDDADKSFGPQQMWTAWAELMVLSFDLGLWKNSRFLIWDLEGKGENVHSFRESRQNKKEEEKNKGRKVEQKRAAVCCVAHRPHVQLPKSIWIAVILCLPTILAEFLSCSTSLFSGFGGRWGVVCCPANYATPYSNWILTPWEQCGIEAMSTHHPVCPSIRYIVFWESNEAEG